MHLFWFSRTSINFLFHTCGFSFAEKFAYAKRQKSQPVIDTIELDPAIYNN